MTNAKTKSERTRTRILDAAARTFRQEGYAGTKLSMVAKRAHMQTGSLYYHFASKDDLLAEVLDIGISRVHKAVSESQGRLPSGASHRDRVRAAVEAHLAALLAHGDYTSVNIRIFGQLPSALQERHIPLRNAYAALWRRILMRAQRAGALRADINLGLVRMLLMGALNWSVEWYKPGRVGVPLIANHVCLLLFNGIGRDEMTTLQAGTPSLRATHAV